MVIVLCHNASVIRLRIMKRVPSALVADKDVSHKVTNLQREVRLSLNAKVSRHKSYLRKGDIFSG